MTSQTQKHHQNKHIPVLLGEVMQVLAPKPGETYLDLTAGYGGHARAVTDMTKTYKNTVLVDRDQNALNTLGDFAEKGATLLNEDFVTAAKQLREQQMHFDMILIDLGVSSPQLDRAERGFSFMREGPLDMRMDQTRGQTAAEYIDSCREDELANVIYQYGEERKSRKIAKVIVENRPFTTTTELAELIENTLGRRGKIHPATRTFQALRIAVNQELQQVEQVLPELKFLLNPQGRLAIISFHSLEDRIVKQYFKEQVSAGYESDLALLTKKPLSGDTESVFNPRSRSAKLRAVVKINKQ